MLRFTYCQEEFTFCLPQLNSEGCSRSVLNLNSSISKSKFWSILQSKKEILEKDRNNFKNNLLIPTSNFSLFCSYLFFPGGNKEIEAIFLFLYHVHFSMYLWIALGAVILVTYQNLCLQWVLNMLFLLAWIYWWQRWKTIAKKWEVVLSLFLYLLFSLLFFFQSMHWLRWPPYRIYKTPTA